MIIYIVSIYDGGWINNAVFKNKDEAKKHIVERYKRFCSTKEDKIAKIIEMLDKDEYIENFAAIETWEVK